MAADFLKLLEESLRRPDYANPATKRPNRTLLTFLASQDAVVLTEAGTITASGITAAAEWGETTNGPNGGNWQWGMARWG
ncbi:MAG: hypothetical protein ACRDUA_11045 [Micromonosporaceae bacterium]